MVSTYQCPTCKDMVYSRAIHDMRSCSCKSLSVDGGFDYAKLSFNPEIQKDIKFKKKRVYATKKELYDDWNKNINNFGIIN